MGFGYVFAQAKGNQKNVTSAASTSTPSAPSTSGSASPKGQVKVHVVRVGANAATKFEPNRLSAQVGEMVQFQFAGGNHTIAQSTFDQPCVPISMVNPKVTGFYSGYMPVSAANDMMPTYTIMISDLTPIWIYCAQGQHCEKGMLMVVNENVQANASRTLENFSALAAKAVTVQMKGDAGPGTGTNAGTPVSPDGNIPKPSGASSKPSGTPSKNSGKDSKSNSSSNVPEEDPDISSSPISSSGKTSVNIVLFALIGFSTFAFLI